MRAPVLLALLGITACAPAPHVVLEFPDAAAEAEAAEMSVYALAADTDCAPLMRNGQIFGWILTTTFRLPLTDDAHLGKLARGPAVFFAQARDASGRVFLRGCVATNAGGDVVLRLHRVVKPVTMREGEVVVVDVVANDAMGNPAVVELRDAPRFATYDAAARVMRLTPGPADQGTYEFSIEPPPGGNAAFSQQVVVTVEDVPRPLEWHRAYRGWVGRFDSSALWDGQLRQLYVTGGRDFGVELAKMSRTLYTTSKPADALTDFRILDFNADGGVPNWETRRFTRVNSSGKFGHAMGFVRLGRAPGGERLGFVLGGFDGAQISGESLLFRPAAPVTTASAPTMLNDNGTTFHFGMAVAVAPDSTSTYLFGGDRGTSGAKADLLEVWMPSAGIVNVDRLATGTTPQPAGRSKATLTLAENPRRLVVIGGRSVNGTAETLYGDAWIICLEELAPKCPPGSRLQWMRVTNPGGDVFPGSGTTGVFAHVAGYDVANDRVITYGGLGVVNNLTWLFEDVFALELGNAMPVDGGVSARFVHLPAPGGPLGLVGAAATQDTDGGRLLIYGGITGRVLDGTAQLDTTEDVWALGLTPGNEKLTKVTVAPQYDVPARRVAGNVLPRGPMMLGGQSESSNAAGWPTDIWRIEPDGGATRVNVPGFTPLPLANMTVTYNPDLDEYWMYGGRRASLLPTPALYRYKLDGGFTFIDQFDVNPRWGHSAAWDERNHRMLFFGGIGLDETTGMTQPLNEVLALVLEADGGLSTTKLEPTGTPPPPRYGAIAGYDRFAQRLLVFGGTARVGTGEQDVVDAWELSLVPGQERWMQIDARGAATDLPETIYFPAGAWTQENPPSLYVIGTVRRQGGTYAFIDGVWRLKLDAQPTWVRQQVPDFAPRARVFPGFAYDEVNQRIFLSGGAADPVFRNDVWYLTLP